MCLRVFIASVFAIEVSIRRQGQRKVIAIVGYNQVFESIVFPLCQYISRSCLKRI